MKFTFHTEDPRQVRTDLMALMCFEDSLGEGTPFGPNFAVVDRGLDGLLQQLVQEEQFKGRKGQTLQVHTHGKLQATRVLLIGGGSRKDFQMSDLRGFAARAVRAGTAARARSVALVVPSVADKGAMQERAAQFLSEGAILGAYQFDRYLSQDRRQTAPEEVQLLSPPIAAAAGAAAAAVAAAAVAAAEPPPLPPDRGAAGAARSSEGSRIEVLRHGAQRGDVVSRGVVVARDLVNEPAAEMTPVRLAEMAQKLARDHHLEARVLLPKECEKLGMGMFLAVARGSEEEPRFIHLTYRPRGKTAPRKKVVLVGKGVTFDSGGLSLKQSQAMEDMKIDMAGGATVLAALSVVADLGCPHEVHAIVACTENMLSGRAYKLGDVLRSMSGKTVEINNTDAEGRLTLGDALTYALREIEPDEIFDFATLTGACMVALGPHIAGVMGNDLSLVERWLSAARLSGEEMWHLPLPERLKDMLKSEIADMRNTGERYGGALTAGLFLKEFVGDVPWVHVDLAGPASADKEWGAHSKGATGFGVATIVEYLVPRE